ncbi:MAG: N-acetylglucosamine kinase [Cohaesibacter sp.]|jgi:glucosamine kinase|nr:N-acetylglucosamine kinase [Cohaesibacter sp.]
MAEMQLYLGLDGGGTQCRGRLRDSDGQLLSEAKGGPANTNLGLTLAQGELVDVARQCLEKAGYDEVLLSRLSVGAGLAGLHLASDRAAMLAWDHPFACFSLESDAHTAWLGAHAICPDADNDDDKRGDGSGILILGTGSCGFGKAHGQFINIGGWGFMLSDGGSGARAGYLALRRAIEAHDGLIPPSPLTAALLDRFGNKADQLLQWVQTAKPRAFGAFAKEVVAFAQEDDLHGRDIMTQCAKEASQIVGAMATKGIGRIALVGGFAPHIAPLIEEDLRPLLVPAQRDACDGAILLAGGRIA